MDIMELGAIGELVGGVAVIGSLIYVGLQVRHSNQIATNAAAQTFRQLSGDFVQGIYSDEGLAALYLAGCADRETLPPADRLRFDMMLNHMFRNLESQYLEHLDGHLDSEILLSYQRSFAPIFEQPGGMASWGRQRTQMTARFAEWVDRSFSIHPVEGA